MAAIDMSPAAAMPLIRALDRFAASLAEIGKRMDTGARADSPAAAGADSPDLASLEAFNRNLSGLLAKVRSIMQDFGRTAPAGEPAVSSPAPPVAPIRRDNPDLDRAMGLSAPNAAASPSPPAPAPASRPSALGAALAGLDLLAKSADGAAKKLASLGAVGGFASAARNAAPGADRKPAPGGTPLLATLGNLLKQFGPAQKILGTFSAVAAKAAGALTKFNLVTGTASAVIAAGKRIPGVGAVANVGQAGFGMIGKRLTSDFAALSLPLSKFTKKAETLTVGLQEAGKASHAYSSAVKSSTATMAGAAQGFMKAFGEALSNPMAGLPALVGAVRPFVEAFNPYALQQFDDALRTVYAVIGEALVPIVKMAAGVLREFAGYLRPVMKQLEPVFAELAQMAGGFLKDLMPELAKFAAELVPIFRQYLEQMKESISGQKEMMIAGLKYATGQMSLLGVLGVGIRSWLSKLPLIGRFFKRTDDEADADMNAAKALVPKENLFSFGAPTNPQFKGVESLGRDTLQAAYAAMPGMEKKKDEKDLLAEIAENTRKTADNTNKGNGVDAATYDQRVEAGRKKGASWADVAAGTAQWGAGQIVEGVYNFGVGVGNIATGRKFTDNMVDI